MLGIIMLESVSPKTVVCGGWLAGGEVGVLLGGREAEVSYQMILCALGHNWTGVSSKALSRAFLCLGKGPRALA